MLNRDSLVTYITQEEIQSMIHGLCRQVEDDYSGESVTLICALKGSLFFLADFVRELKLEQEMDFVQLSNRGKDGKRGADCIDTGAAILLRYI